MDLVIDPKVIIDNADLSNLPARLYKKLKLQHEDGWENDIGNATIVISSNYLIDVKIKLDESKYKLGDLINLPGKLTL